MALTTASDTVRRVAVGKDGIARVVVALPGPAM